jgi:hypothetical protein
LIRLPLQWTSHLKDEAAKENFRTVLVSSSIVVDRLIELLQQMEDELSAKEINESHFDKPSWEVRQAFYLGQKARLKSIKDLFKWRTTKL